MPTAKLPRGAFVRLIFCSQIITIMSIGIVDERSLTHILANSAGEFGFAVLYSIVTLALVGLADNLINDYSRWSLQWTLDQRHFIYMAMAFCYALLAGFALHSSLYSVAPYMLLNVGLLVAGAFYDIRVRYWPRSHSAERAR